jgi:hypothetical protein
MWKFASLIVKKIVGLSFKFNDGFKQLNQALLERGLVVHFKDYYGPFVSSDDIKKSLDEERNIPGLKLDLKSQKAFLKNLNYDAELVALPDTSDEALQYAYTKGMFGPGDAEILYGVIRHLKPSRIVEIGAGSSSLIAQLAIKQNKQEDEAYTCSHVCVEPYENPWLEKLGIEIIRKKVEDLPVSFFKSLEKNDILFVDSSHVVKPQGDVLFEIFDVYGAINSGVYIHVHDIFTPRDYPRQWVIEDRKLWHEQYLLEAFLSFNDKFEIVCALNWIWKNHPELLGKACPVLTNRVANNPGSFWFRRI